jgi:hypothetical protein
VANTAVLAIRIIADATKATKTLDDTGKKAGKWGKAVNAGAVVGAAGLTALAGVAVGAVRAAAEDAKSQELLALALKNSAGAHDDAIKSTEDWIAKTSLASGVADDDLRPALASLVRATGDVAGAQDALSSAMDISAATGQDVQSVAKALAKGYAGNTGAIGKLGLGIDKATLKSGDMKKIMEQVNKTVGGASAAAAGTAEGEYARLHVALNETQETLGGALLPALTAVLGVFVPMLAALSQNQKLVYILAAGFALLSAALIATKVYLMATTEGTVLHTAATTAANIATKAWTLATKGLRIALIAMKLAFASNPIGAVIVLVMLLVGAFILAYKKVAWFRNGVNAALRGVQAVVGAVVGWVKAHWPLLLTILLGPFGPAAVLIIKNLDKIKAAFRVVFDAIKGFIKPVVDAIQSLIDMVKKVVDAIGKIKVPHLPDLNPFSAAPPTVTTPALAAGRTGARVSTSTGTGATYQIFAVDPQQTARLIQRLTHNADVRSGRKRYA